MLLSLVGTAGAYMIANKALGGGLDVQTGMGFLGIAFVGSLAMAYINIKRLQIEQHRAWMLRAWFYVCLPMAMKLRFAKLTFLSLRPAPSSRFESLDHHCDDFLDGGRVVLHHAM